MLTFSLFHHTAHTTYQAPLYYDQNHAGETDNLLDPGIEGNEHSVYLTSTVSLKHTDFAVFYANTINSIDSEISSQFVKSFGIMRKFIEALPNDVPCPSLDVDPDGTISMDWVNPFSFMLSIGIDDYLSVAVTEGDTKRSFALPFNGYQVNEKIAEILLRLPVDA